jgi:diaminopimelate decarboxylase
MKTIELFPASANVDEDGQLWLGGCSTCSLVGEYGTPLYVFDQATLQDRCRTYRRVLKEHYPGSGYVAYASKAYLNLALAQLFAQEGLSLDVVSGGELYVALQSGFPSERVHFHGNNKSPEELAMALDGGVGRIVVDNFYELETLERLAAERHVCVPIWLRLSPGIDAHTHDFRNTGLLDSKFGFPVIEGTPDAGSGSSAELALTRALRSPHLELVGLHAHIGSQVHDLEPFTRTVDVLLDFSAAMSQKYGFELNEFSPGGGWGVPYHEEDCAAPIEQYVKVICAAIVQACGRHGLALPELVIEPGRSIVAPAAVALYRVGARKEIPGVRTYVAVDGGMADNIRPALYGARYTALVANKANEPAVETVTIAGKFCESGDVLVRDVALPRLEGGDILAIPMVGAYCLSLASNYNLALRPAVVLVRDGRASLVQRRNTLEDLLVRDFPLPRE